MIKSQTWTFSIAKSSAARISVSLDTLDTILGKSMSPSGRHETVMQHRCIESDRSDSYFGREVQLQSYDFDFFLSEVNVQNHMRFISAMECTRPQIHSLYRLLKVYCGLPMTLTNFLTSYNGFEYLHPQHKLIHVNDHYMPAVKITLTEEIENNSKPFLVEGSRYTCPTNSFLTTIQTSFLKDDLDVDTLSDIDVIYQYGFKLSCAKPKENGVVRVLSNIETTTAEEAFISHRTFHNKPGALVDRLECSQNHYAVGILCDEYAQETPSVGYGEEVRVEFSCVSIKLVCQQIEVCSYFSDNVKITFKVVTCLNTLICLLQIIPRYEAEVRVKTYSKSNGWNLIDDHRFARKQECPLIDGSNENCGSCDLTNTVKEISFTSSHDISIIQTEAQNPETFQIKTIKINDKGKFLGEFVNDDGNDRRGSFLGAPDNSDIFKHLIFPPHLKPLNEIIAWGSDGPTLSNVAAISFPNINPPNTIRTELAGAIVFVAKGQDDVWHTTSIVYGIKANQHLGKKRMSFINDNRLEIISNGFEIDYLERPPVSFFKSEIANGNQNKTY